MKSDGLIVCLQYTVNHAELSIIFLESAKISTLSKALPKVKQNVKTVVYWGSASSSDVEAVKKEVSFPCSTLDARKYLFPGIM